MADRFPQRSLFPVPPLDKGNEDSGNEIVCARANDARNDAQNVCVVTKGGIACAAVAEWRRARVFRGARERRDAQERREKAPAGTAYKSNFLCALRERKIPIG